MKFIIRPKNLIEAFSYHLEVPFYSFKQCLSISPIEIDKSDIKFLSKKSDKISIHYVRKDFEGYISLDSKLCVDLINDFEFKNFNSRKYIFKTLLQLFFSAEDPFKWIVIYLISFFAISNALDIHIVQLSEINGSAILFEHCGTKCIRGLYWSWYKEYYDLFCNFGAIVVSIFFFNFKSKHNKNALFNGCIKSGALSYILIFSLLFGFGIYKVNSDRMILAHKILWDKNYSKNKNKREIASEIEFVLDAPVKHR